jgi:L-fuculose-phosphate aldolase
MDYTDIRQQVFDAVQQAVEAGLIYLSAGNISARVDANTIAITPGGVKYKHLRPEQIAIVDVEGNVIDAPNKPSSETPMHTALFRAFPHVNAVFHTHSSYAITFAMLGQPVPVANLELLVVGAPIPVAPWACPGTAAPGIEATKLFRAHPSLKVVLLRNHGLLAIGDSLDSAFDMAFDAEQGMRTYHQSLQVGTPNTLTDAQIQEVKDVYF